MTTAFENSIKNTMTAVEVFLKTVFAERVSRAEDVLKVEKRNGSVFQRLAADVADIYRGHLSIDLPAVMGPAWDTLVENMAARHVLAHASGFIDPKYLNLVPTSKLQVGQRLVVNRSRVDGVLAAATVLGNVLVSTQ